MKTPLVAATVLLSVTINAAASAAAGGIYESSSVAVPMNEIDTIVFAKLAQLKIKPVLCSDAVFLRRAYLDVIGTQPTAAEAATFLADKSPGKRIALIDRLMQRSEFADYWAMKWSDILRIKAEYPVNLWPDAAEVYHHWVRQSIAENKHYDCFARELLTSSGSNFRVGAVNFYRAIQNRTPEGIAAAVALTFMGSRAEDWPAQRLEGMAAFFSQVGYKPTGEWKEQCVFWDPLHSADTPTSVAPGHAWPTTLGQLADPKTAAPVTIQQPVPLKAMFPDGAVVTIAPDKDPRDVFADWLINAKNPWFARAVVNRVWAWIMGRGIIEEPDDIRPTNPPSNPQLLAYLDKDFVDSGYDLRHLYRLIFTSTTYQLSSVTSVDDSQAAANFAHYPVRRLDAEVLIDAINQITGTHELYTSAIPEPFTYIPKDMRAIQIADGSITSPFLTLFGRSDRATGMFNERSNKVLDDQWLHMLNSTHIQQKLESSAALSELYDSNKPPSAIIDELYLRILSRHPTQQETEAVTTYGNFQKLDAQLHSSKIKNERRAAWTNRRQAWLDVTWALLNSPEFLMRH